ncbi:MAG TPA: DNA-deoxyinosine glycosylase [Anaerolineae bacterium]|nr:DNA-deoxyinosine glycosylase [Anaerolineae bacterium]
MTDELRVSSITKQSIPPIIEAASRVLILGTMPGDESLRQQQYYAHPRNHFWRILAAIYHEPFAELYSDRVALLHRQQLALWDVLQHCERPGSLDQAIRNAVPNDFRELFATYRNLQAIVFNGRKAHELFERQVLPQQSLDDVAHLPRWLMPSTSPAATLPLSAKIERWRQIAVFQTHREGS